MKRWLALFLAMALLLSSCKSAEPEPPIEELPEVPVVQEQPKQEVKPEPSPSVDVTIEEPAYIESVRALNYLLNGNSWGNPLELAPAEYVQWACTHLEGTLGWVYLEETYHVDSIDATVPAELIEEAVWEYFGIPAEYLRSDQSLYCIPQYESEMEGYYYEKRDYMDRSFEILSTEEKDDTVVLMLAAHRDELDWNAVLTLKKNGEKLQYQSYEVLQEEGSGEEEYFVQAEYATGGTYALDNTGRLFFYEYALEVPQLLTENVQGISTNSLDKVTSWTEEGILCVWDSGALKYQYESGIRDIRKAAYPYVLQNDGSLYRHDYETDSWSLTDIKAKDIHANNYELLYLDEENSLWYYNGFEEKLEKTADNVRDFDGFFSYKNYFHTDIWYITEDNSLYCLERYDESHRQYSNRSLRGTAQDIEVGYGACLLQLEDGSYFMRSDEYRRENVTENLFIDGIYGSIRAGYYGIIDRGNQLHVRYHGKTGIDRIVPCPQK